MSDGQEFGGDKEMADLYEDLKYDGLTTFTISFGNCNNLRLKTLAHISSGKFLSSIDEIQLKENFIEISSSLGTKISVLKSFK